MNVHYLLRVQWAHRATYSNECCVHCVQQLKFRYSTHVVTQYTSKYVGWRWALLCVRLYVWSWNALYYLAYFVPFLAPCSLRALVDLPYFMFYKQCPLDGTPGGTRPAHTPLHRPV